MFVVGMVIVDSTRERTLVPGDWTRLLGGTS